jgi:protein O-GlcNAc transferase
MAEPETSMTSMLARAIDLHQQGRLDEAEANYRIVLKVEPSNPVALHQIGLVELQRGRLSEADKYVSRALQIDSGFATGYLTLGAIRREMDEVESSLEALNQAVSRMPQNPKAFASRAFTLIKLRRHRDAINDLECAIQLGADSADCRQGLGVSFQALGELDAALPHYQRALTLNPNLIKVWAYQGLIHYQRQRWAESLACFQRVLQLDPNDDSALGNCAELHEKLGHHDESLALYQQLVERQPTHALAHYNIGHELHRRNEFDLALVAYDRALALDPQLTDARGNRIFILQTTGKPVEIVKAEAIEYGRLASDRAQPKFTNWRVSSEGVPLRVGLVSADLRNHSVGTLLVSVLPELRAHGIELCAYQVGGREDAVTEVMRRSFSIWRKLVGTDFEDAHTIHGDGVHILIDLSGYTRGSRLPLFAYKPAPIQVTWLGYWGTTGLPEMDYLLGDPYSTPISDDGQYTEQVWRLPRTRWCFSEPIGAPSVGALPFDRNRFVTFGLFNHYRKFTPQLLDLWCDVLRQVPESRVLVKNNAFADSRFLLEARGAFLSRGVELDRITLEGPGSREEFWARLNDVDFCLDTFPAAGGLTTLDCLWMGAPVLACRGHDMLSRQGELILSNIGLKDWLAVDPADYVKLAIKKSEDIDSLRLLRYQLRSRLRESVMMNAPHFSLDLAHAFRQMWSAYRAV